MEKQDSMGGTPAHIYTGRWSVIEAHRRQANIRVQLPQSVKQLFRKPQDETSGQNLEAFRGILCSVLEGEKEFYFAIPEEVDALISALHNSSSTIFPDELGLGSKLDAGTRIILKSSQAGQIPREDIKYYREKCIQELKDSANSTEGYVKFNILQRPRHTKLAPALDGLGDELFREEPLEELPSIRDKSIADIFDRMLLVLWDALFLDQCVAWTKAGVSNLPSDECLELGRWFCRRDLKFPT